MSASRRPGRRLALVSLPSALEVFPNLGIGTLTAVAERAGHEVRVIETQARSRAASLIGPHSPGRDPGGHPTAGEAAATVGRRAGVPRRRLRSTRQT